MRGHAYTPHGAWGPPAAATAEQHARGGWQAAATFYTQALGFHPAYGFSRVRNGGEAKAAGVEVADAAVRVLHVPGIGLSIELLQLGTTKSVKRTPAAPRLWEPGAGVGHLSLKVRARRCFAQRRYEQG